MGKGEKKPKSSSSSRAADLNAYFPTNAPPSFSSFSSFASMASSGASALSPQSSGASAAAEDALSPKLRALLSALRKRDAITKKKTLVELEGELKACTDDEIAALLPLWPRLYSRLSQDTDRHVREHVQKCHAVLTSRANKKLAPFLKTLMGPWLTSQFEPHREAASLAKKSFDALFPADKLLKTIVFTKAELFQYLTANITDLTEESMQSSSTDGEDDVEIANKFERVITACMLALATVISVLCGNPAATEEEKAETREQWEAIIHHPKFHKLSTHASPLIRAAVLDVLAAVLRFSPQSLGADAKKLSTVVLNSFSAKESSVIASGWVAATQLVSHAPETLDGSKPRKSFLPLMFKLLREGGRGNPIATYSNVSGFVSALPEQLIEPGSWFAEEVLSSLRDGGHVLKFDRQSCELCWMSTCNASIHFYHWSAANESTPSIISTTSAQLCLTLRDWVLGKTLRALTSQPIRTLTSTTSTSATTLPPDPFTKGLSEVARHCAQDGMASARKTLFTGIAQTIAELIVQQQQEAATPDALSRAPSEEQGAGSEEARPATAQQQERRANEQKYATLEYRLPILAGIVRVLQAPALTPGMHPDLKAEYLAAFSRLAADVTGRAIAELQQLAQSDASSTDIAPLSAFIASLADMLVGSSVSNEEQVAFIKTLEDLLEIKFEDSTVQGNLIHAVIDLVLNAEERQSHLPSILTKACGTPHALLSFVTLIARHLPSAWASLSSPANLDLIKSSIVTFIASDNDDSFPFLSELVTLAITTTIGDKGIVSPDGAKDILAAVVARFWATALDTPRPFAETHPTATPDDSSPAFCKHFIASLPALLTHARVAESADMLKHAWDSVVPVFLLAHPSTKSCVLAGAEKSDLSGLCQKALVDLLSKDAPSHSTLRDRVLGAIRTLCTLSHRHVKEALAADANALPNMVKCAAAQGKTLAKILNGHPEAGELVALATIPAAEFTSLTHELPISVPSIVHGVVNAFDVAIPEAVTADAKTTASLLTELAVTLPYLEGTTADIAQSPVLLQLLTSATCSVAALTLLAHTSQDFADNRERLEKVITEPLATRLAPQLLALAQATTTATPAYALEHLLFRFPTQPWGTSLAPLLSAAVLSSAHATHLFQLACPALCTAADTTLPFLQTLADTITATPALPADRDARGTVTRALSAFVSGHAVLRAARQSVEDSEDRAVEKKNVATDDPRALAAAKAEQRRQMAQRLLNHVPEPVWKQIYSVFKHVVAWQAAEEDLFTSDKSSMSEAFKSDPAAWPLQLSFNADVARLFELVVFSGCGHLSSAEWDVILCSNVAWSDMACFKSDLKSFKPASLNARSLLHAVASFAQGVHSLFAKIKASWDASALPEALGKISLEWDEFFSDALGDKLLTVFMAEGERSLSRKNVASWALLDALAPATALLAREKHVGDVDDPMKSLSRMLLSHHDRAQATALHLLSVHIAILARPSPEEDLNQSVTAEDAAAGLDRFTPLLDIIMSDTEEDEEDLLHTIACMLAWIVLGKWYEHLKTQERVALVTRLKEKQAMTRLVPVLFDLLPQQIKGDQVHGVVHSASFDPAQCIGLTDDDHILQLVVYTYFIVIRAFPALVRQWWEDLCPRQLTSRVEDFTAAHITPALLQREMEIVKAYAGDASSNFVVKARPSTREVVATYTVDTMTTELVVSPSASHPLRNVEVSCGQRVGVAAGDWRRWMLQMVTFLANQNGSILDAMLMWKKNVDKRFEGVEDCTICYSIIHGSNYQLPNQRCRTCKNLFHSDCLYKWFNSSGQSTCPLCRNVF